MKNIPLFNKTFPVQEYDIYTIANATIVEHYADEYEYIILKGVELNKEKYEGEYQMTVSRTNGDLLGKIFPVQEYGLAVLHGKAVRLINMEYTTLGYNGNPYYHQSWLFQPQDRIITKGTDWYV